MKQGFLPHDSPECCPVLPVRLGAACISCISHTVYGCITKTNLLARVGKPQQHSQHIAASSSVHSCPVHSSGSVHQEALELSEPRCCPAHAEQSGEAGYHPASRVRDLTHLRAGHLQPHLLQYAPPPLPTFHTLSRTHSHSHARTDMPRKATSPAVLSPLKGPHSPCNRPVAGPAMWIDGAAHGCKSAVFTHPGAVTRCCMHHEA
jgi:hypothetical protein